MEGEEGDVEGDLDASEVVAEDASGVAGVDVDAGEGDTGEEEAHAGEGAWTVADAALVVAVVASVVDQAASAS